jgi:hypothetical protein
VRANVSDANTDLTKSNVQLKIDGQLITKFTYDQAADRLSYTPGRKLSLGGHKVRVQATDTAGNSATKGWDFRVVR